MAERAVTRTDVRAGIPCALFTWTGLLNGDTGAVIEIVDYADRTVTVTGTFGTGGTIKLQGSNNNTDWFDLTDTQGNAISKTSAAMELVVEGPLYIRPYVSAGDGTTSLACQLICRRTVR